MYDNKSMDVVVNFIYLGITLYFNGNFHKTQMYLHHRVKNSLCSLISKMQSLKLNVNTKLSLFDTYVGSVANYGCEVWGLHPAKDIKKVYLDFCKKKNVLGVKSTASIAMMVYFELDRKPLYYKKEYRTLKYWLKLIKCNNCILRNIYKETLHVCDSENFPCWISFVKQLLNNLGFGYTCKWDCQECFNESLFLHELKQRLNDWFILEAHSFFEISLKCNLYTYLNNSFQLQPYLLKSISEIQTQYISKYRLFVHQLELERGRFF